MSFNLDDKRSKYICIHCKEEFSELPKSKLNECCSGIQHFIVEKTKLKSNTVFNKS